ncbi:STE20-related kinase adapter protein alpha-like isoform X2 [Orbicella faveolata]|uniref:STE20-related kinase adapter protein alpha-like isoform X2 n=1 Tax=Orbicella faveolata TaxID=48498 RepID=UPI0009E44B56|nr:STE20-related kinase adapter protein alpha-like isoform X2 [Orbicella faveolata]
MSHLCICVDTAHVAVSPEEVVNQVPNQQSPLCSTMSEVLSSHQPRVMCLPNPEDYSLLSFIGQGFGGLSKVFVARHCSSQTLVVVKQTNVDVQNAEQFENLKYEVQVLRSLCHPNILPCYCSFVTRQEVWNILPLMQFGSCADMLKSSFPEGMSEILIAAILWEILQGLDYLHKMGIIHRAVKGSHILIGTDGAVCLSGLRKSIMLPQEGSKSRMAHHFPSHAVAVLPWMAPEILQQDLQGYDVKSDIYSVGITAIQLARGTVPYIGMPPTKVLLEKLKGSTPKLCDSLVVGDVDTSAQLTTGADSGISSGVTSLGEGREGNQVTSQGKYTLAFQQVVDACLQRDPSLRPTTTELASHLFFKQVKRKTKELLPELLSTVPSLANCEEDKRIGESA